MNVLIILSILFIIIWYCIYDTEGFEDVPINPNVEKKYKQFASFYNSFLVDWEKAIVTSIGLDTPVKELTSPDAISSATFKAPTQNEMNQYIKKLEKTLNKPFPLMTNSLPDTLTPKMMADMAKNTLLDPTPYQNAVQLMVKYQEDAQNEMEKAKQSPEGFDDMNPFWMMETFENCDQYKKCMTDPEVMDAVARAQAERQAQEQQKNQNEVEKRLDRINGDKSLQLLTAKNKEYMKKAQEIQDKANSGTLLNDFKLSNNDTSLDHFIKPKGISNLANMKKNNPGQYKTYEKNNSQMMALAGLNNSISNTLSR
jgi:hypothetical protein